MTALVRLRLAAFLRTGRALAPVLAGLLALATVGVALGGGLGRGGPRRLRLATPLPGLTA
ncbi:hypothetical protein EV384_0038 [Micromonospora kangleipakensis]|uniref:Uncharacterized protein n=1 Tax=Micromonospora kangleipakensis TaxID=1077942 RepID=A0A4Q8B2M7_9ACTN|nr:hypothetical protein [Micromonospora kangleipakensis]RZU71712.1 hypothetical protein EV384_0038 [Micromonospora kangleipakensis]